MEPRHEYKFARLGEGWVAARKADREGYQEQVHAQAREARRLGKRREAVDGGGHHLDISDHG
jgi:hypothetical protein